MNIEQFLYCITGLLLVTGISLLLFNKDTNEPVTRSEYNSILVVLLIIIAHVFFR